MVYYLSWLECRANNAKMTGSISIQVILFYYIIHQISLLTSFSHCTYISMWLLRASFSFETPSLNSTNVENSFYTLFTEIYKTASQLLLLFPLRTPCVVVTRKSILDLFHRSKTKKEKENTFFNRLCQVVRVFLHV